MGPWTFALATLALWSVARMVVKEDGPAFLFFRFRTLIGVVETEDGLSATNIVALVFTCPLCLSLWFAIPLTLLLGGGWLEWLAMSGAARVLFRFTESRD